MKFDLSLDEINVVLHSLGALPYAQVFALVNNIQMQAQTQLNPPQPVAPMAPVVVEQHEDALMEVPHE